MHINARIKQHIPTSPLNMGAPVLVLVLGPIPDLVPVPVPGLVVLGAQREDREEEREESR